MPHFPSGHGSCTWPPIEAGWAEGIAAYVALLADPAALADAAAVLGIASRPVGAGAGVGTGGAPVAHRAASNNRLS